MPQPLKSLLKTTVEAGSSLHELLKAFDPEVGMVSLTIMTYSFEQGVKNREDVCSELVEHLLQDGLVESLTMYRLSCDLAGRIGGDVEHKVVEVYATGAIRQEPLEFRHCQRGRKGRFTQPLKGFNPLQQPREELIG